MSEDRRIATQTARSRPWWIPWAVFAAVLGGVGNWIAFAANAGTNRVVGEIMMAAAGIALLGVVLTHWWWGRAIMGVRFYSRKHLPFLFTVRGWAQACLLALSFGAVGGLEYTMEPDFCTSCHMMVPYYQAWHQSTHKNVRCTDCHFAPGVEGTLRGKFKASSMLVKQITTTYGSMPHAEIEDASCLRGGCHGGRQLHGEVQWQYTKPNGAVVHIRFDHKPHLGELRRGKQLRCTSCHGQIVQGEHIAVTLDTCFTCHFKGLRTGRDEEVLGGCTACHAAPTEKIRLSTGLFDHKGYIDRGVACYNCHSDSIKGEGEVPRQVCINCHNKPEQLERFGDSNFMHENHVSKHKLRCTECHTKIEHRIDAAAVQQVTLAQQPGDTCARCHQSMHAGPSEMYRGIGGRGVPEMPSSMYRAQVDCIACHQVRAHGVEDAAVEGQTYVAAQQACNMCHGDTSDPQTGKYAERLGEWKKVLDDRLKSSEAIVQAAQAKLTGDVSMADITRLPLERKLADARHNLTLVRLGHGVHNFNYAIAVLSAAEQYAREVEKACGADPGAGR